MKTVILISLTGILMLSCAKSHIAKTPKRQKTPSHLVMSQSEKTDVNYDARENQKVVSKNIENKDANFKSARKKRAKETADLNKGNENSSKVKKKKLEKFTFY